MTIRKAAALIPTTKSFARFESRCSKKRRVSDERLKLDDHVDDAPETQLAIVPYTVEAEPINCVKKKKSCKPRKPRETIYNGPNPNPNIPIEFMNMIENLGGTDLRLIIQKGLCGTDLSKSHGRLSLPSSQWIAEQDLFDYEFRNSGNNCVSLPLIDTKMRLWESVSLKKWKLSKAIIVISGEWNDVAAVNGLKIKDVVQIWCFKFVETGRFGLAMVKIENEIDRSDQPQTSPCVTYFDFLNIGSFVNETDSNECEEEERVECHEISNSESDRVGGVSSNEIVFWTISDVSSSDIDLSLHL